MCSRTNCSVGPSTVARPSRVSCSKWECQFLDGWQCIHTVQYSIVWYSTVQYSTVQYSTVQYIIQFLAALSSSRSLVVGRLVRWSVGPSVRNVCENLPTYLPLQFE